MDLSKLSSNLPLSQAPTDESIHDINKELSDEFKIGARSIAALYRLSNSKNSLLIAKGYLDCVNDISKNLQNGELSSINDLQNFLLSKKLELGDKNIGKTENNISGNDNCTGNDNEEVDNKNENKPIRLDNITTTIKVKDNKLDNSFKFSVSNPTNHHFPPTSHSPLSLDHKNLKYYHHQQKQSSKSKSIHQQQIPSGSGSSSDEEVGFNDDSYYDEIDFENPTTSNLKRKLLENSTSHKKLKFDS